MIFLKPNFLLRMLKSNIIEVSLNTIYVLYIYFIYLIIFSKFKFKNFNNKKWNLVDQEKKGEDGDEINNLDNTEILVQKHEKDYPKLSNILIKHKEAFGIERAAAAILKKRK